MAILPNHDGNRLVSRGESDSKFLNTLNKNQACSSSMILAGSVSASMRL
jgi:hypothetical protein